MLGGFMGHVGRVGAGAIIGGGYAGMKEGRDAILPGAVGGALVGGGIGGMLANAGGVAGMADKGLGWAAGKMTQARKNTMLRGFDNADRYSRGRLGAMANTVRSYGVGIGNINRTRSLIGSRSSSINKWGQRAIVTSTALAGSTIGQTMMSSNGSSERRRYKY